MQEGIAEKNDLDVGLVTPWSEKVAVQPVLSPPVEGKEPAIKWLNGERRALDFYNKIMAYRQSSGRRAIFTSSPESEDFQKTLGEPQKMDDGSYVIEGHINDVTSEQEAQVRGLIDVLVKSFVTSPTAENGFSLMIDSDVSKSGLEDRQDLRVQFKFFKPDSAAKADKTLSKEGLLDSWSDQEYTLETEVRSDRKAISIRMVNDKVQVFFPDRVDEEGNLIKGKLSEEENELFRLVPESGNGQGWRIEAALTIDEFDRQMPVEVAALQPGSKTIDSSLGSFAMLPGTKFLLPDKGMVIEFQIFPEKKQNEVKGPRKWWQSLRRSLSGYREESQTPSMQTIRMKFTHYDTNQLQLSSTMPPEVPSPKDYVQSKQDFWRGLSQNAEIGFAGAPEDKKV